MRFRDLFLGRGKICLTLSMMGLFLSVLHMIQPLIISSIINQVHQGSDSRSGIAILVLSFIVIAVGSALESFLGSYLLEDVSFDLRKKTSSALMDSDLNRFSDRTASGLASATVNDPRIIAQGFQSIISSLPLGIITVVSAMVFCIYLLPSVFIIALSLAGLAICVAAFAGKMIRSQRIYVQQSTENLFATVTSIMRALPLIQHYRTKNYFETKMASRMRELRDASIKIGLVQAVAGPLMDLFMKGAFLIALLLGAIRLAAGDVSLSVFVSFVMYFQLASSGIQQVLATYVSIQEAHAGMIRVNEFHSASAVDLPLKNNVEKSIDCAVEIVNVSMKIGDKFILKNFSMGIPKTGVTVIVGPSGAGKTTLLKLLIGMLSPTSGEIRYRSSEKEPMLVGYVDQEASVVNGTVFENVAFGREWVKEHDVFEALSKVGLSHFAEKEEIQTVVGEVGVKLSGGERQRIALARALVSDIDLLVLDEPTAGLDGLTEQSVLSVISDFARNKPVVIVAHRPRTIAVANNLVFIDSGEKRFSKSDWEGFIDMPRDISMLIGHPNKLFDRGDL